MGTLRELVERTELARLYAIERIAAAVFGQTSPEEVAANVRVALAAPEAEERMAALARALALNGRAFANDKLLRRVYALMEAVQRGR